MPAVDVRSGQQASPGARGCQLSSQGHFFDVAIYCFRGGIYESPTALDRQRSAPTKGRIQNTPRKSWESLGVTVSGADSKNKGRTVIGGAAKASGDCYRTHLVTTHNYVATVRNLGVGSYRLWVDTKRSAWAPKCQPIKVVAEHGQVGGGKAPRGKICRGFPGDCEVFARCWWRAAGG